MRTRTTYGPGAAVYPSWAKLAGGALDCFINLSRQLISHKERKELKRRGKDASNSPVLRRGLFAKTLSLRSLHSLRLKCFFQESSFGVKYFRLVRIANQSHQLKSNCAGGGWRATTALAPGVRPGFDRDRKR